MSQNTVPDVMIDQTFKELTAKLEQLEKKFMGQAYDSGYRTGFVCGLKTMAAHVRSIKANPGEGLSRFKYYLSERMDEKIIEGTNGDNSCG